MIAFRHRLVLVLLLACGSPASAQDVPPGTEAAAPAEEASTPGLPPAPDALPVTDAMPPVDSGSPGTTSDGVLPVPDAAAADDAATPAPTLTADPFIATPYPIEEPPPLPAGQATLPAGVDATPITVPAAADRTRALLIMISGGVLLLTLTLIVVLLIRRGRDARRHERQYVAEAYLRDVSGSTTQSMFKLGSKPVMLGRVGGKETEFLDYIVIPSATIGRRHALIEFKDFGYWIMDQGSINGTFVNNRPVSTEVRLKHGDRIRLHKLEFEFVMPEVSESSVTVLAPDAPRAAAAAAAMPTALPAESDFVLDLEPEAEPVADDLEALRKQVESDDATLLPSGPAVAPAHTGNEDETLLPASGAAGAGTDETLLPSSGAAGSPPGKDGPKKKGDEFFDITGGD